MMPTLAKALTLKEFLDLPETKSASEYIDGQIIQKPMPKGKHSAIQNILHCLKHGTPIGWLIDPAEKTVFVYRSKQETEVFDEPDQVLPVPSLANELQLTVQDLFAWLS